MTKTYPVSETTLVFAFRYALGRHTGATTHVVEELKRHWNHGLSDLTKEQIHRDIRAAIERGECEVETWQRVLEWSKDDCPACGMVYYNCLCSHEG